MAECKTCSVEELWVVNNEQKRAKQVQDIYIYLLKVYLYLSLTPEPPMSIEQYPPTKLIHTSMSRFSVSLPDWLWCTICQSSGTHFTGIWACRWTNGTARAKASRRMRAAVMSVTEVAYARDWVRKFSDKKRGVKRVIWGKNSTGSLHITLPVVLGSPSSSFPRCFIITESDCSPTAPLHQPQAAVQPSYTNSIH